MTAAVAGKPHEVGVAPNLNYEQYDRTPFHHDPGEPREGNKRADANIRADEFANGYKEPSGGMAVKDTRPSKGMSDALHAQPDAQRIPSGDPPDRLAE